MEHQSRSGRFAENRTRWILVVTALSFAGLYSTPAFAQCSINGGGDTSPSCTLNGPLTFGTYTDSAGTVTFANGTLTNTGSMGIQSQFRLTGGDVTLSGGGTLTLSGGLVGTDDNYRTLTNNNTIVGYGTIGANAGQVFPILDLNNAGIINANSGGLTLSLSSGGGATTLNSGIMEATGGGILSLATSNIVNNNAGSGGNITAGNGSTVNVSTGITGGTLNTLGTGVMQTVGGAALDGASNGAILLSDGSTYTAATGNTYLIGTLNLGTTTGSTLALGGVLQLYGDATVAGPGAVTMTGGLIGTDNNFRTLNNQTTIQGYGTIGANAGIAFPSLNVNNNGVITANSAGNTLILGGSGSNIRNSNTLEATSGGILSLTTNAAINNSGGNITASGAGSTVNVSTAIQGGTLNTSGGGVMQTSGSATLDASSQGAITISDGSTYTAGNGTLTSVVGTLNLGTTTGGTLAVGGLLRMTGGDVTLAGPGTVILTNGQIGTDNNYRTLYNQATIQGYGGIGSNVGADFPDVNLNNTGTINANSAGNALTLGSQGATTINSGTLEATNGGILNLATNTIVNNNGGTGGAIIAGNGSTVNVSTGIAGGTLTTLGTGVMQTSGGAALDGASQGAILLTDGSTYTAGANTVTYVTGTLNLGTTTGSTLAVGGLLNMYGDVTLAGPGSVTLTGGQIGTNNNYHTLNNQVTIQGYGAIGSNVGADFPDVNLNNTGTINANSAGNALTLSSQGATTLNSGTLEATNGGILNLSTNTIVNNNGGTGGSIIAGNGSTVNVSTGIAGGTLTTLGTGVMQTTVAGAALDGASQGAILLTDGSTYTAGAGTVTYMTGTLNLGTTTGSTLALSGLLNMYGDVTLAGPGSVTMNGGQIGTNNNFHTLYNQATIQGSGTIGSNVGADFPDVILNNTGTVNANSAGNTLALAGNGAITNTNLLEATSGGILNLQTSPAINNFGGNITASGAGSTVNVNTTIQGGTLNTSGGGVIQTNNSIPGSGAFLDGSTQGAITISDGSTYTAGSGSLTQIAGAINLGTSTGGTLALSGQLLMTGDVTLSGPGSLTISGGQIGTNNNFRTLTNQATIQGNGLIGSNDGALFPQVSVNNSGSVIANAGTLQLGGSGTLTNTGTLQANTGSTLLVSMGVSGSTYSSNTMNTGTYNAYGTIQINALGSGGGEIVTNNATILLSGAGSLITDSDGTSNALSAFAANGSLASFSLLNGASLDTLARISFSNAGFMEVDGLSSFSINGGEGTYTQSGGTTNVDGSLDASLVEIAGGFLTGSGTVDPTEVIVGTQSAPVEPTDDVNGTVRPGDGNTTGTLTIDGTYDQLNNGNLIIGLETTSLYDVLDINGNADFAGSLSFDLLDGFQVQSGDVFYIVDYDSREGIFNFDQSGLDLAPGLTAQLVYNDPSQCESACALELPPGSVELEITGTTSATPEPSTWFLFAGGLGLLAAFRLRGSRATLFAKR